MKIGDIKSLAFVRHLKKSCVVECRKSRVGDWGGGRGE